MNFVYLIPFLSEKTKVKQYKSLAKSCKATQNYEGKDSSLELRSYDSKSEPRLCPQSGVNIYSVLSQCLVS